jgi:hypothetical protein
VSARSPLWNAAVEVVDVEAGDRGLLACSTIRERQVSGVERSVAPGSCDRLVSATADIQARISNVCSQSDAEVPIAATNTQRAAWAEVARVFRVVSSTLQRAAPSGLDG